MVQRLLVERAAAHLLRRRMQLAAHTSAYVCQHTSAYVSTRQHTHASIRQHTAHLLRRRMQLAAPLAPVFALLYQ